MTRIRLSSIGIGAVKFGRTEGLKYPQAFSLPTDRELIELLNCAEQAGLNWIDTAESYGSANLRLGATLQGRRSRWNICTKIGERFIEGRSQYDFSPSALERDLRQTLRILHTDYVDILLLHLPSGSAESEAFDTGIASLLKFKAKGLARAIGASVHDAIVASRTLDELDYAMIAYNPSYQIMHPVLEYAPRHSILIKQAFSSGRLIPPFGSVAISDALTSCLSYPSVAGVAIGTTSTQHLLECIRATNDISRDN